LDSTFCKHTIRKEEGRRMCGSTCKMPPKTVRTQIDKLYNDDRHYDRPIIGPACRL